MADLTLSLDDAHVSRVREAVGSYLGLGTLATAEQVRAMLIDHLRKITRDYEKQKEAEAAAAAVADVTIS